VRSLRRQHRDDSNRDQLHSFWTGLPGTSWVDLMPTEKGMPDALLGCWRKDQLVEIKVDGKWPTEAQEEWAARWQGRPVITIRKTSELQQLYLEMRG